ncbi:hypothetical protein [Diaphorobacter aerolatus]|nr:hypothetical protein [Diaphorobacter aerolatus]
MNRCNKPSFPRTFPTLARQFASASVCAVMLTLGTVTPLLAQTQAMEQAVPRNFPPSSQRGDLVVKSSVEAVVEGKDYRLAPGLRIFNQQNQLVFAHSVVGQKLDVRYVVEPSTGMLLNVWILTKNELAKEPKRGWFR